MRSPLCVQSLRKNPDAGRCFLAQLSVSPINDARQQVVRYSRCLYYAIMRCECSRMFNVAAHECCYVTMQISGRGLIAGDANEWLALQCTHCAKSSSQF